MGTSNLGDEGLVSKPGWALGSSPERILIITYEHQSAFPAHKNEFPRVWDLLLTSGNRGQWDNSRFCSLTPHSYPTAPQLPWD